MILDRGIAEIFARSNMAPKGEKPIWTETLRFRSWYAELSFETSPVWQTERRLAQKADARIRIAQCREIRQGDTAHLGGRVYTIARAYHGTDEESGEDITDLTLEEVTAAGPLRTFASWCLRPIRTLAPTRATAPGRITPHGSPCGR